MTRLLVYISLLLLPLSSYAWQADSTDSISTGDTITAVDGSVDEYDESYYDEGRGAITPPPPPVYAKKTFDKDFKERYADDDFNYEEEKAEENWAQKFFSWIRKVLEAIFGGSSEESQPAGKGSSGFPIFRLLAVLIIGAAVYFIVRAVLQKDGYWIFGRSSKRIITNDLTAENLHEMDFSTLIVQTKGEQNYRLALRYYYLWLLKKMAAQNIIEWNWEKTNNDYYYEIKDSKMRDDFKYLSYVYDYSWYGEFPVDEKNFGKAETAFKKALNNL